MQGIGNKNIGQKQHIPFQFGVAIMGNPAHWFVL